MRIVVLHEAVSDGAPPDATDLLAQVQAVEAALRQQGNDVQRLVFAADLASTRERLRALQPDCVFNLVESVLGEERLQLLAPALLESLGIPFTGAPYRAFLGTANKPFSKRCLRDAGLPTPNWWDPSDAATWQTDLGARAIVKSVWEHGSVGLDAACVLDLPAQRHECIRRLAAPSQFAEAFVEGREFNVSLLDGATGPVVLPPAEIVFLDWPASAPRIVDYGAKWDPDSLAYSRTQRRFDFPRTDGALLAELQRLARAAWDLFGLRGYGRVDFRVDVAGQAWILEVNTNPCLTPDAGFAAALERAGIAYADALAGIVRHAAGIPGNLETAGAVPATSHGPAPRRLPRNAPDHPAVPSGGG